MNESFILDYSSWFTGLLSCAVYSCEWKVSFRRFITVTTTVTCQQVVPSLYIFFKTQLNKLKTEYHFSTSLFFVDNFLKTNQTVVNELSIFIFVLNESLILNWFLWIACFERVFNAICSFKQVACCGMCSWWSQINKKVRNKIKPKGCTTKNSKNVHSWSISSIQKKESLYCFLPILWAYWFVLFESTFTAGAKIK